MIGRVVVRVDRVGSTNDLARALAEEGAREGTVVVAREQTGGRGRMGRAWASPPGGLWLSVLLQPDDPADPRLALVVGIGVVEALRGNAGAAIGLKWPNDLMLGGRKVGGVLVESAPPWAVAGIGVNVNVDRADLPAGVRAAAVSLAEVLGRHLDLEEVGASVLTGLDEVYAAYRAGRTAEVLARWRRLSVTTGRLVRVQAGGRVIEGTALDIDDDGALLVVPPGGTPQRLLGGDVTVLDGGGRG